MFNSSSSGLSSSSCKLTVLSKIGEWPAWAYQMVNYLEFNDLGEFILDEAPSGEEPTGRITRRAAAAAATSSESSGQADPAPAIDRSHKDRKAKAAILMYVAPEIGMHLSSHKSARDVWIALEGMFCQQSHAARLKIRGDLQNLSQSSNETLQEYFARAQSLRLAMTSAGAKMSEEDIVSYTLNGLCSQFTMARTAIITSGDPITMTTLLTKLLPQEQLNNTCSSNNALLSWQHGPPPNGSRNNHNNNSKQGSSENPHKNLKCHYCHKVGHVLADCRKKKRADERRQQSAGSSHHPAHMAVTEEPSEEFHGIAFMATSTTEEQPEEVFAASTNLQQAGVGEDEWIMDSGCTKHIVSHWRWMKNMVKPPNPVTFSFANGSKGHARLVGECAIKLNCPTSSKSFVLKLKQVYYVPEATANLISIKQASQAGLQFLFADGECIIKQADGNFACTAVEKGGLHILGKSATDSLPPAVLAARPSPNPASSSSSSSPVMLAKSLESPQLWHQRFCHLGYENIATLQRHDLVTGINVSAAEFHQARCESTCVGCTKGKQHRQPFQDAEHKSTSPLQLIHSDLCGPFPVSLGGNKYFGTVLDDFTGYSCVFPLKSKSDMASNLQKIIPFLEKQSGMKVRAIRTDNGGST